MAVGDGESRPTANLVAKNLAGPIHQHFFCVRMDLDIDGAANTVYEVDTHPLPVGPDNPHANAFAPTLTPIRSESEAGRSVQSSSGRHWRIVNPGRTNAIGEPVGYTLHPGETVDMMAGEEAAVSKRAAFARKQLWVTRESPDELYAAGAYPSQSTGGDGMPTFTSGNRALENEDVVLWYVVGVNHLIRPRGLPHQSHTCLRLQAAALGILRHQPRARCCRAGGALQLRRGGVHARSLRPERAANPSLLYSPRSMMR